MSSTSPAPRADALHERYRSVRAASTALADSLSAEDCALQSMTEASPTKWHLAHTSWFFETFVLLTALPSYRPFHPAYRVLFNSYYHSVGRQHARPERGLLSRPTLDEIRAYRAHVDEHMLEALEKGDATDLPRDVVELGIHHEQQHQELILTDLKHLLSRNPLAPVYREGAAREPEPGEAAASGFLSFPGGLREIGHGGGGFHFDNEGPRHRVWLEPFELASRVVTNAEFLAFMEDGGYRNPLHWLADGWATVQQRGWQAPLYWEPRDGGWQIFTLGGLREVSPDEPVCHVSYYEAAAFASWAEARLPDEAEWEWVAGEASRRGNFLESGSLHPRPARGGDEPAQLFGDVWEWSRSAHAPYPGYRPPEGALGEYNGKFMSNQMVLRGGSCATPESHVRASYRNFFYPDARWQFSGIRLARDLPS